MLFLRSLIVAAVMTFSSLSMAQVNCSQVANNFAGHLWQCWNANSQGCIPYYLRRMPSSDIQSCRSELRNACINTCYDRWGQNDRLCNNGCNRL